MHKAGEMYDVLWLTKGQRVGCTSTPVNVGEEIRIVGHEEPFKVLHVDHESKDYFVYQPEVCDCPHASTCHEPRQRVQIGARKRIEGLTVNDCDFYKMIFTEKELEIVANWGFNTSVERPLSEEEKELYFKITNG